MIVYAWRCEGCNTTMVLTEAEHTLTRQSSGHSCALMLSTDGVARRCAGRYVPFAQWAAEAIK